MTQPWKFLHRVGSLFTRKQMMWAGIVIAGLSLFAMLSSLFIA